MTQQAGETRDAIIEDDNKQIEEIVNANKHLKEPYWIVLFAKPAKVNVDGMHTLMKYIKPYKKKPESKVGMVIGEVCNKDGTIKWEVNMPQVPFDFELLPSSGRRKEEVIVETTSIPNAYITK